MQYRHGDVFVERVAAEAIPAEAQIRRDGVVAYGEVTGHAHRVVDGLLYEAADGTVYIEAETATTLTHEEHGVIPLPAGIYRVTQQREWDPYAEAARRVID